jgi:hypothetical protein
MDPARHVKPLPDGAFRFVSFRFYPRRRRLVSPRRRRYVRTAPRGSPITPSPRAPPAASSDWLGHASRSLRGVGFRLGFRSHFAAPGDAAACGRACLASR